MTRKLNLAVAQMGPIHLADTRERVVRRLLDLLGEAKGRGAELVVFPELALTTFFPRYWMSEQAEIDAFFEREMPSAATRSVFDEAKKLEIGFYLGYAELTSDGHRFNTSILVDRRGRIVGRYRKIHIPGAFPLPDHGALVFEKLYFTPGNLGYPVFDLGFARIGVQICYERNFPEGYRILAMRGAEIIFTPTNLMRIGDVWNSGTWELALRARAYENGCFIVGINKAGNEWGLDYVGDSLVARPTDGEVIAHSEAATDDLLVVDCDLDLIDEARRRLPFMRDRQPRTYEALVEREA